VIYIAGCLGQTFSNGSLTALYITRIISGFGIGGTTVVPSVYLSEIAPKPIRGLITVQYAACQQLGVVRKSTAPNSLPYTPNAHADDNKQSDSSSTTE
jgi:hypothetical protein